MRNKDVYGFECDHCRERGTTTVTRTVQMPDYILRVRKCNACGHEFETLETSTEMTKLLRDLRVQRSMKLAGETS